VDRPRSLRYKTSDHRGTVDSFFPAEHFNVGCRSIDQRFTIEGGSMKTLLILLAVIGGLFLLRIIISVGIRLFVFLFLRKVARAGLEDIGRQAQDRQPDTIHLSPQAGSSWKDPAGVERMTAPLIAQGFKDAGAFTIREMPGVQLRFLTRVSDSVYACVCDHPKVGVWLDLISRFQDGTSVTFCTNKDRGIEHRPGKTMVYAPGTSAEALFQRMLAERPKKLLASIPEDVVKMFEDAYAEDIAWRKKRGPSAKEVAKVVASRS
jgi:hypothetical protein